MVTGITVSNLEQFRLEAQKMLAENKIVKQEVSRAPHEPPKPVETDRQAQGMDKVTLGEEPMAPVGYDPAMKDIDLGNKFMMLEKLVVSMLQEQGIAFKISTGTEEINISSLTPEEATALVTEDGYFGVEQTATRIFELAVGIAGGDKSKIDSIRSGIETGFNEAEAVFGGSLPEISYETRDAVMAMLDQWYEGGEEG